jgi:hypothetical protein
MLDIEEEVEFFCFDGELEEAVVVAPSPNTPHDRSAYGARYSPVFPPILPSYDVLWKQFPYSH